MIYRIAVCDDSSADSAYIASLVTDWSEKNSQNIDITTYPSAESFLFGAEEVMDYDILLLDIEMGKMNGVELAKEIRKTNERTQIVFITGYPDFIAEGYDVAALHYLMKPVSYEKLSAVLNRAVKAQGKEKPFLMLSVGRETNRIYYDDIQYAESQGHYVIIHTDNGDFKSRMTVPEIAEKLSDGFYRCSRSFVVSLRRVSRITKSEVFLKGGASLPLGRGQYEEINEALIKYLRSI